MTRPSSHDAFSQRARALEDEFFHERDQQLIANLRHELSTLEEQHKLTHVSGIVEQKVLLDLVSAGVTGESLLAVRMIPMVIVAWSDHIISVDERAAVLKAAADDNILPGTAAHELLLHWLQARPRQQVVDAWKEYVQELAKITPPEALAALQARTTRLCTQVAKASSGFWSSGAIPPAKQAIIDQFVQAWIVKPT